MLVFSDRAIAVPFALGNLPTIRVFYAGDRKIARKRSFLLWTKTVLKDR
jgi:hypothetical protein